MQRLPFGDPDGSKADFDDMMVDFVVLDTRKFPTGISASEDDRTVRVIVGKKGAGKTVYLRRLRDSVRREDSLFASKISEDVPSTGSIVKFSQMFDTEQVTEAWQQAWRIALLRSAICHITTKAFYSRYENVPGFVKQLSVYKDLVPNRAIERSAYTEIKELIANFDTEVQFSKFARDARWDEIQTLLGTALKACPPIFLYLDAVDDEFAHAPFDWHRCQKGLFYAVMRFMRSYGSLGSRFHVVIAIRDIVYSSVLKSENQSRYRNIPQICLLDWDYEAIKYFFNQKIAKLNGVDVKSNNISDFVGISSIENKSRGIREPIDQYLIRHTRSIPRDIVHLGNQIATEKVFWDQNKDKIGDWEEKLRILVARNARAFAEEQIQICANQLSSHDAPKYSGYHGYTEIYTSNKDYIDSKSVLIKKYIKTIGCENFTGTDLINADELFSTSVAQHVKISTILWQNGLIGVRLNEQDRHFSFYRLSEDSWFELRTDCYDYCFHSIIMDAVSEIVITRTEPNLG